MSETTNPSPRNNVPINEDILVRLVEFLKIIAASILKVYPVLIAIGFFIFFAILAFLAFFSSIFFPSTIP